MTRRSILPLASLLVCACATAPGPWTSTGLGYHPVLDPQLEVRNDHWLPMRVFLVADAGRYFLGEVEPGRVGLYRIPRELVPNGTLRLLADPSGSTAEHLTAPLQLGDARQIAWRLKKNLDGSRPHVI